MFATRFFANRAFAPRYFAKVGFTFIVVDSLTIITAGTHPRGLVGTTHRRDLTGGTHPRILES
jgi:hypothetical protein